MFTEQAGRFASGIESRARANVESLLAQMSSTADDFHDTVRKQFAQIVDILFVSTVASGLFGSTSDIDLIAVLEDGARPVGMSTMMFLKDRRLGVKAYTTGEVDAALTCLKEMGRKRPTELASCQKEMLATTRMTWVDLERCVNGFSFMSGAPYSHHLPDLSEAWFSIAFDQFRRAVILGVIADRAGEERGRYGYALVAVRNLMDLIMAAHGWIHSNLKWVQQRWAQFKDSSLPLASRLLVDSVTALADGVHDKLIAGSKDSVAGQLIDVYGRVLGHFSMALVDDDRPVKVAPNLVIRPFVGESEVALVPGGGMVIVTGRPHEELFSIRVSELLTVDRRSARALLSLSRARCIDFLLEEPLVQTSGAGDGR